MSFIEKRFSPNRFFSKTILVFIFAILGVVVMPAQAQDFSFQKHPILNAKADANGVDMASGSYIVGSPFDFKAPGAGHLNVKTLFNGRKITFNLNIYIEDETYTPVYSDPTERHLKVHLGGPDKLFKCSNSGPCTPTVENDGSTLTREASNKYVYKDADGTVYTFFDTIVQSIAMCDGTELSTCNMAEYMAHAFVSTIQYPNGEKLTYQPFMTAQTIEGACAAANQIDSNLGYKIIISMPAPCNYVSPVTRVGETWLYYYSLGLGDRTIRLYKGSTLLGAITNSLVYSNAYKDAVLKQQDNLGRIYQVNLHADGQTTCLADSYPEPESRKSYTSLNPVTVILPSGLQTSVVYHDLYVPYPGSYLGFNVVPVKTVTRGGRTWSYDLRHNGKTATNPMGGTRSVTTVPYADGYPIGNLGSRCNTMGLLGDRITTEVDELGRQTGYENDNSFPTKVTLPEGDAIRYGYDSRHNLTTVTQIPKPGSGLADRVIKQVNYDTTCANPKTCNQPNWVKDAKLNQTDYTYWPVHGGVATATAPADNNGLRQRIFYTYESYDTGAGVIYRQTRTESCGLTGSQLTLTACPATVATAVTITTYLGSTFLPQTVTQTDGAGSLSVTTTYGYNDSGNVTSIDGSRTDVDDKSYKTYDAAQRLVYEIGVDPDGSGPLKRKITKHGYDADNRELRVESGVGYNTDGSDFLVMSYKQNVYDAAGLLLKTVVRQP